MDKINLSGNILYKLIEKYLRLAIWFRTPIADDNSENVESVVFGQSLIVVGSYYVKGFTLT